MAHTNIPGEIPAPRLIAEKRNGEVHIAPLPHGIVVSAHEFDIFCRQFLFDGIADDEAREYAQRVADREAARRADEA